MLVSSIAPDDWRVSVLGKDGYIPAIFKIVPGFLSCSLVFGIFSGAVGSYHHTRLKAVIHI